MLFTIFGNSSNRRKRILFIEHLSRLLDYPNALLCNVIIISLGVDVVQIGNTRHFHDTPHHKGIVSWQYDCHDVLLHQLKSNPWWEEAANFYLNCCGVDERPPDHAICTAKIESQTICNNNATRGIDCFALKEHTQMTVDRTGNDVFVRDEDIDME